MDKPSVYVETSIVSYLAADPSRHPVTLRNQQLTHRWWNTRRHDYALFTSQTVLYESAAGDPRMARLRIALLASIPFVHPNDAVTTLASELRRRVPLPPRAEPDALHLALATYYGVAHLLTWNCKHIANPRLRNRIEAICSASGYHVPNLCTPREMLGE
jgi:hypothetical protein